MNSEEGKYKEIELSSEEVQDVLGKTPPWILRWGISLLFVIILALLIGSWFFKYPDTIAATMMLTSANPPAAIVAKTNGTLKELYVNDKQSVIKGDYLVVIENPASTRDMQLLKNNLKKLLLHPDSAVNFHNQELHLGIVQGAYTSFIRLVDNYKKFIELDYYPRKIASIKQRILQCKRYCKGMEQQQDISKQQYLIAGKQYKRDSILSNKRLLSQENIENTQNLFLQSRLALENSRSSQENIQMQISQMEETLLDTQQQYQDNKMNLESELNTMLIGLINEINTWEMNYVLVAPIDGKVTFTSYWSKNQNITVSETVLTIIPHESKDLIGKALLPVARSGKVKNGQMVNIHFLNYPDEEFGMVKGMVDNISLVPTKDNYTVEVTFPKGLMTSYNRELPFSQEMTAQIEIVTEDLRLMERLFLPIKKILKKNL